MTKSIYSLLFSIIVCIVVSSPAKADTLVVGGTGSSGPIVQKLFEAFAAQQPDLSLKVLGPPLGSTGALKALSVGRIDLAVVGRPLAKEELDKYGVHFDLADTAFVMASKDGKRPAGFTLQELAQVYEGTLQKWDNGDPIRLVMRSSVDSDTLLIKSMAPVMDKAMDTALKRPGMTLALNDLDTVSFLDATPGTFGPTSQGLLSTLGARLTVFKLDGVAPSLETLRNGSYPWFKRLTIVLPRQATPLAGRFAAFLLTPQAREVLLKWDHLPVKP